MTAVAGYGFFNLHLPVCLTVFPHDTVSQKSMQLGSPNLTY